MALDRLAVASADAKHPASEEREAFFARALVEAQTAADAAVVARADEIRKAEAAARKQGASCASR